MLPPDYQHGVGILIAALKKAGHEADLIYVHEELSEDELVGKAREFGPGLLALSTVSRVCSPFVVKV